jgi:hypothetical protein
VEYLVLPLLVLLVLLLLALLGRVARWAPEEARQCRVRGRWLRPRSLGLTLVQWRPRWVKSAPSLPSLTSPGLRVSTRVLGACTVEHCNEWSSLRQARRWRLEGMIVRETGRRDWGWGRGS